MAVYVAAIFLAVEADNHAEACDAIAEALRPIMRAHEPESSALDWQYAKGCEPGEFTGPRRTLADPVATADEESDLERLWNDAIDARVRRRGIVETLEDLRGEG